MRKVLLIIVVIFSSCKKQVADEQIVEEKVIAEQVEPALTKVDELDLSNVDVEILDFNELKPFLEKKDSKIHVVNFWATWCAPCVKELPYFETVNEEYKDRNVEVTLVSLDFPNLYKKRLLPYVAKHKLKSKVVMLDAPDENTWIPEVNKAWSGAIPATLIYNNEKSEFYEKSFTLEELKNEVNKFLK